jgi:hypothetical protein
MFWEARQVPLGEWEDTTCDLAMRIRRPRGKAINCAARNVPIVAFKSFDEGQITGRRVDRYYLKFDAGLHVAERRVAAAHKALVYENSGARSGNEATLHLYKRDFYSGAGFQTLLNPPV